MRIKVNVQRYPIGVFWKLKKSIFQTVRHPRKISNLLRSRFSQFMKRERVGGYPPMLLIEPSSFCNLRCPMCARTYMAGQTTAGNMPLASFRQLISEVGDYLLFLKIFGYGEPLLNPDILEMIRLAKSRDIFVVMSTNGLLLDPAMADRMLEAPPDLLIISLDAVREETYKKCRVGGDFNKVLANIRYLAERKKVLRKSTPLIDLQFLAMKDNEAELAQAGELVRDVGADKYSLKKVAGYYTDSKRSRIQKFLPDRNPEYVYSIYADPAAPAQNFCGFLWREATVAWDGKLLPCCKDIDSRHVLGNAFDGKSFLDTWNNERYRSMRSKIRKDIDCIDICRGCNRRVEREGFLK